MLGSVQDFPDVQFSVSCEPCEMHQTNSMVSRTTGIG